MIKLSNGHQFQFACASGALAYGLGWWWERFILIPLGMIDPHQFTIITKTLTFKPIRAINWLKPWEYIRPLGDQNTVNAVKLTNPGIEWWVSKGYPKVKKHNIIVSVMPESPHESKLLAYCLKSQNIKGIEINLSCPNVQMADNQIDHFVSVTKAMVKTSNHPIGIKLGYQDPYMEICSQLKGYIQWVDVINTVPWNMIRPDPSPLKPFAGVDGGVSGPCIAQHARKVLQDLVPVGIPILSGGGIFSYPEVETRFNLGASAVTFATLFSYQPWKPNQIVNKWNRNHATHAVTK